ncbi:hypothetical protein J6590_002640 [Homalodisca vitripennis]|nr:hypothetical protein J6590_002640 [Homalodisca vitripennis]
MSRTRRGQSVKTAKPAEMGAESGMITQVKWTVSPLPEHNNRFKTSRQRSSSKGSFVSRCHSSVPSTFVLDNGPGGCEHKVKDALNPEHWPEGALVRMFRPPRNPQSQQEAKTNSADIDFLEKVVSSLNPT